MTSGYVRFSVLNMNPTDRAHESLAAAWACAQAAAISLELATRAAGDDDALALADHDLSVAIEALDAAARAVAAADPLGDRDTSPLYADLDEVRAVLAPVRSGLQPAAEVA